MPGTPLSKGIFEGYTTGDDGWGAEMNENLRRLNAYAWDQWANNPETTSFPNYGYRGGVVYDEATGLYSTIAGGTVALTDNATNYVERTIAGTVSVNQVGFTLGRVPMAQVTTAAGVITAIVDYRPALGPSVRATHDVEGWFQDNVAASQSAVLLTRLAGPAFVPAAWIAPKPGSVVGVYVKSGEARTGGTLTVEVFKNGATTGLTAVLDATNTTFKFTGQAINLDTFVAGDELDLRITTDAGWTPVTADVRAGLLIEF